MLRDSLTINGKPASRIGFGCSRIGSFNNPMSPRETRNLLAAAVDLGVTLFDTADVYGQGDSERELGRLIAGARGDGLIVVTKAGKAFSAKMRLLRPFKPVLKPLLGRRMGDRISGQRSGHIGHDFAAPTIRRAVEGSLRRLRTERLDALLLHSPPADALDDPALGEALRDLQRAGKLGCFGVSCDDLAALKAALAMPGLALLELPADVLAQASAHGLDAAIRRGHIGVLSREVIRLQPRLGPVEAVRACLADGMTQCAVIGTTKRDHLAQIVQGVAEGPAHAAAG